MMMTRNDPTPPKDPLKPKLKQTVKHPALFCSSKSNPVVLLQLYMNQNIFALNKHNVMNLTPDSSKYKLYDAKTSAVISV